MADIEYTIKRTMRRNILIRITTDATVQVLAPKKLSRSFIDGFVQSKREWICSNLELMEKRIVEQRAFQLETFRFLGKDYPVRCKKIDKASFSGKAFLVPEGDVCEKKAALVEWMKKEGKPILERRAAHYASLMGVSYENIKMSGAKTRWGSCSSKKNINFTWRLLFASPHTIDYVVVHELTHLTEMNHSDAFWQLVGRVIPDYRDCQLELKELQNIIELEQW